MSIIRPNFRGKPAKRLVTQRDRVKIKRLGANLDRVLRRCTPKIPKARRKIAVGIAEAAMLRHLQGYFEIYPGNEEMAEWGDCDERTVRRHMHAYHNWGFVVSLDDKKGGYQTTNCYQINLDVIIKVAITCGGNPSMKLVREIRDYIPGK